MEFCSTARAADRAARTASTAKAADAGNNAVRRIDAAGNVTTYGGVMGQPGSIDGPIATARFGNPRSVALAPDGSLYVADNGLRKISADGSTVSTIAAAGNLLEQIAIDSAGTVYYSNQNGLYMLQNGVSTLLIPITHNNTVLGTNPKLALVLGLAVLGPKQLVILGASEILLATLP